MIERIGSDVRGALLRLGPAGAIADIVEVWTDAVGETVARRAWPARLARDGTLHVATESSTWAFELAQLAPNVLERLRERVGAAAPRVVRFAPGVLPSELSETPWEQHELPPEPGPEERALAARFAAEIDDEELRELVVRAAAASLAGAGRGAVSDRRF